MVVWLYQYDDGDDDDDGGVGVVVTTMMSTPLTVIRRFPLPRQAFLDFAVTVFNAISV